MVQRQVPPTITFFAKAEEMKGKMFEFVKHKHVKSSNINQTRERGTDTPELKIGNMRRTQ